MFKFLDFDTAMGDYYSGVTTPRRFTEMSYRLTQSDIGLRASAQICTNTSHM